ncbi:alpha-L-fucosidase [Plantibacter sp. M259]|uniref:alpha-L-fucosidase n=1 Tax=Plantibacter sp. M259 TaxID=2583822 RepID=UPI002101F435|nr:alpha-L-fucosidase [Plantibacter sp. M259]
MLPVDTATPAGEGLHGDLPTIGDTPADQDRRRRWESWRVGAFVHWGVSSLFGGQYAGQDIPGLAEWIQSTARIPRDEYRRLAAEFNPVRFDADEWVLMAARAGARYLVFTAKHHDGFAMYRSRASSFNIVDATRFRRDPLAELAAACRKHGVALGIYYSHVIDWADPDAVGPRSNDWDTTSGDGVFERYWRSKAMPQLTELLTEYGEIASVWFDMPAGIAPHQAAEAARIVRELQPTAVINSRVGVGGVADYESMDDNYFNTVLPRSAWETAATTNDSWGFVASESRWKTSASLCETIAFTVSRGGNLLLNFGPDGAGSIPARASEQFREISRWMRRASPAIHGASGSPFPSGFDWGYVTSAGTSLYVHITDPSLVRLALPGLRTQPLGVSFIEPTGCERALPLSRVAPALLGSSFITEVPAPSDDLPRLVKLTFGSAPDIDPVPAQSSAESIRLDVGSARSIPGGIAWDVDVVDPGDYRVVALSKETSGHAKPRWDGAGLTGRLEWATPSGEVHTRAFVVTDDGREFSPVLFFWQMVRSEIGTVEVPEAGRYTLKIRGLRIKDSKWTIDSLNLAAIRLELPAKNEEHPNGAVAARASDVPDTRTALRDVSG